MAQFTIVIPDDMEAKIIEQSTKHMVSKSAVIRWALEEFQKNDWQRVPRPLEEKAA